VPEAAIWTTPGVDTKRNDRPARHEAVTVCGDCRLEEEYLMTLRLLTVLVERLQVLTGSSEVQISDAAFVDLPDFNGWRNEFGSISLTATR